MLVLFLCCVLSCEWLFVTPWTVACQASLSDFASKITGAGCHFLLQGIFPTQEWNLNLGHLLISCLSLSHQGSPVLFHHFHFHALEKDMATHSSVLAWRIPGMGESGGLPSMGSHRVRHNWSDLAAAAAGTKQFGSKFSPSFKYKIRKSEKILCLYPGIKKKKKAFCLNLCCSVAKSCPTRCASISCSTPGFPVLHYLSEHAQTHFHCVRDTTQPSHPLSLLSPPALIFPSFMIFSNEEILGIIRWPEYWSFSFSISSSSEFSGLISFRINWFDLLAVQGTLKSLLQHHSLKASILWRSAFFMV